ncbi:MAG: aromatic ring-hydroxylating dioxygenase subunit alpha [Pseudomonadales bacterium]
MKSDLHAPGDPGLPPGAARSPGPSPKDILDADGDSPPQALRRQSYEFQGDAPLPFERYTSQAFFEREHERLWSRVWQWACREEHVSKPGDYYVYDIGERSALVIRGKDGNIRAFANSCPHRGMQFSESGSCGSGKQFIRCPFHGMSWHLDGSLREIPCRWDFPHVRDEAFGLSPIACDTWGGFVFVNFDADADSLRNHLEVLPEHFQTWPLEDRFVSLHMEKVLPGNWKMCMEGFLEAYHVLATHPQGLRTSGWANTQYDIFSRHVTRFFQTLSSGNPHYERQFDEDELFEMLGHDRKNFVPGRSARAQHADALRTRLGAEWDVDLGAVSNSEMLDSIEYHLFPNACFFPGITIPLIYRFRPLTVDTCVHDVLMLQPVPKSRPRPLPARKVRVEIDERYEDTEAFGSHRLSRVLDQDTANFARQWAGMKAALVSGQTLGNYQEARIRHFHHVLDEYLA